MTIMRTFFGICTILIVQLLKADATKYKVTNWSRCIETKGSFVKLTDISIAECVDACVSRQACMSLGYNWRLKLCEIHKEDTLSAKQNDGPCVFIERKDMDTTLAARCSCSHVGHVCNLISGQCNLLVKEYYYLYEATSFRSYNRFDLHNDGVNIENKTSITFETKGGHDAHILLQYDRNVTISNVVEIRIGGWTNTLSQIKNGIDGVAKSQFPGSMLDSSSYVPLWISWDNGCVRVGKENIIGANVIMEWCGLSFSISGMRISYCCGNDGYFRFSI